MRTFGERLDSKFNAAFTGISNSLHDVDPAILSKPDLEDDNSIANYNRTIISNDIPHVEDDKTLFQGDIIYIGMKLGLPRDANRSLQHVKLKRRAISIDGTPMGTAHDNNI